VIVKEDHRAPVLVQQIWYRAGSMDESTGTTGVAHVLEHLMFKGTKAVPAESFPSVLPLQAARERFYQLRLHRLFPATAQSPAAAGNEAGVGPHEQPAVIRRGFQERNQGGDGRAALAHR